MKKAVQILSLLFFLCCSAVLSMIIVGYARIPDEMTIQQFDSMAGTGAFVCQALSELPAEKNVSGASQYNTSVKLFNIFPVKNSRVSVTERKYVIPGGSVFGIRLYTKGVMVIKIDEVSTPDGNICPGKAAGLKQGDMILSVDGKEISENKTLSKIISSSEGKTLVFRVKRGNEELELRFKAAKSSSKSGYKGGLWIRDSTAGIGTLTFCDPQSGIFGGLGHAVCDVDTGEIMPLSGGEAVEAEVKGCYKSSGNTPGELCGIFSGRTLGSLYSNGSTGIYGSADFKNENSRLLPVALDSEVKEGPAQIISTVDDSGPKYYDIQITKVCMNSSDRRDLVIKVTDRELIEKTGGIVQGMSGSPIIQDSMIVGAVTHVFVDNPKEGYGIFVQSMIETEESIAQKQNLGAAG